MEALRGGPALAAALRKTIRFATVELDQPHVALDRLQSGDINLLALVPKSEEVQEGEKPAEEKKPEEQKSGWHFGIDYVELKRGGVRFRDLLIPGAEPLALNLESIEVRDIALEPRVYGGPSDIRFVVKLDEGALRTRARFTPKGDGGGRRRRHAQRDEAAGPPLARLRAGAWHGATSRGYVSLALRYRLETGGRNELTGTIGLDD
jgi:hypothetical protein